MKQARALVEPAVARLTVTSWHTGIADQDTGELEDSCSVSVGTAFAVYPNLLVTAAHVVRDSDRVRVTLGTMTVPGTVVGYNQVKDVALIRIERKAPRRVGFAKRAAKVGDEVATLGYTQTYGLSFLSGSVNRVNTKSVVDAEGGDRHFMTGLTEVDFPAKGGNSGGPVFDTSGAVVGILVAAPPNDAGGRLVVPSSTAAPLVDHWRAEPDTSELEPTTCTLLPGASVPTGAEGDEEYSPAVHSAALTLLTYIYGVSTGDYRTAFAQLARGGSYKDFVDGVETSEITTYGWNVVKNGRSPTIDLDFRTQQDAGKGPKERRDEQCTDWHLRYRFEQHDGIELIGKVRAQPGFPADEPCSEGDAD